MMRTNGVWFGRISRVATITLAAICTASPTVRGQATQRLAASQVPATPRPACGTRPLTDMEMAVDAARVADFKNAARPVEGQRTHHDHNLRARHPQWRRRAHFGEDNPGPDERAERGVRGAWVPLRDGAKRSRKSESRLHRQRGVVRLIRTSQVSRRR